VVLEVRAFRKTVFTALADSGRTIRCMCLSAITLMNRFWKMPVVSRYMVAISTDTALRLKAEKDADCDRTGDRCRTEADVESK
jgi:hypothetical protein